MLTAVEPDGTVRQEVRTVVYKAPKVAAATPPATTAPPARLHERWAVVIGVGRYESAAIPAHPVMKGELEGVLPLAKVRDK